MLLCIDIGNTNTVIGIFRKEELLASFRIESNLYQTADEYGIKLLEMFKYHSLDALDVEGVIISSVVPILDSTYEKMIAKYFNKKPLFVGPGIKTGIKITTDNPKQVGADIIVGAVASHHKYGAPVIIIDMGTAITFFYVDKKKELVGGIIAPGVKTSFKSLISNTSKLEEVKMNQPLNIIGRDTIACIQSAMIYGTSAMIDGVIRKMKEEIGLDNIKVVLTGGEAKMLHQYLEEDVIYDENIIIEGLKIIYQKNL